MKTKQVTKARIDDFKLGYWSEEEQQWYSLADIGNEGAAKYLKCSPELVDFLRFNFEDLLEQLKLDLTDIWEKSNG